MRCSGFNYLLLPKDRADAQIVDELKPGDDEIQICKTTDSALTGTNLRLLLANMGIKTVICTGIFTDQCVASTVRSLADESFDVLVRIASMACVLLLERIVHICAAECLGRG